MIKNIIEEIDTEEAQNNFVNLLNENKTYFLNGDWGSGKSTFMQGVGNKSKKKIVELDLWRVTDNRTVVNKTFYTLIGINHITILIAFFLSASISILASDKVNLGLAKYIELLPNCLIVGITVILNVCLVISFIMSTIQLLSIKSDDIYIWLLKNKLVSLIYKNKILMLDDFDRVTPDTQREAYKVFNILNGKLPIVFLGDIVKIENSEDKYLQKIVDRYVELPYVLSHQSIWRKYFEKLSEELSCKIDKKLIKLFIREKRNLREREHFHDYVNLEFCERDKKGRVQVNELLLIIYLYLFHRNYYLKLINGWKPSYTLNDGAEKRIKEFSMDNAIFESPLEQTIDDILSYKLVYPECFFANKTAYLIFETINNLPVYEAEKIVDDTETLERELFREPEEVQDLYKFIKHKISSDTYPTKQKDLIINKCLELLKDNKNSFLIENILRDSLECDGEIEEFERKYLDGMDLSQKLFVHYEVLNVPYYTMVYKYYIKQVKKTIMNETQYKKQRKKPYLLSMTSLDKNKHWIYDKEWPSFLNKHIEELSDIDYLLFWKLNRVIRLQTTSDYQVEIKQITKIEYKKYAYISKHEEKLIEIKKLFPIDVDRIKKIAKSNNITYIEIN